MPLSEHVLTELARIGRRADKEVWYGPYNALLYTLFPINEHFIVAPEPEPIYAAKHIHSGTFLRVDYSPRIGTVLLVQIRRNESLDRRYAREAVDTDMRNKIRSLVPGIVAPKVYALSTIGTRFAVYEYVQATNSLFPPVNIRNHGDRPTEVAPASIWEYDILEAGGQKKIEELVAEIKQMCESTTGHGTTYGE